MALPARGGAFLGRERPPAGAYSFRRPHPWPHQRTAEEMQMSKGMDQKKEQKKKPAKTMKEKKAEKKDKKATKGFAPT